MITREQGDKLTKLIGDMLYAIGISRAIENSDADEERRVAINDSVRESKIVLQRYIAGLIADGEETKP